MQARRTRRTVATAAAALLVPLAGGALAHADTGREGTLAQQQEEVDTDSDWEWIGIFGLLGLLGLVPRRRSTERTAHEPGRGARP